MPKTVISFSCDPTLLDMYRERVGPRGISQDLCRYIEGIVYTPESSLEKANYKLAKADLIKYDRILRDTQIKRNKAEKIIKEYEEVQEYKESERLQREKEKALKARTCIQCSQYIEEGDKINIFPAGPVCQHCFLNASGEHIKKWKDADAYFYPVSTLSKNTSSIHHQLSSQFSTGFSLSRKRKHSKKLKRRW